MAVPAGPILDRVEKVVYLLDAVRVHSESVMPMTGSVKVLFVCTLILASGIRC